ncbi:MAG: hypothetical protein IPO92_03685 [Saprospiraceae bacterium]|nr:hypothetical protein [Saprospiraceae bacterium]
MDKEKETNETWNKVAKLYQKQELWTLTSYNDTCDIIYHSLSKLKNFRLACRAWQLYRYLLSRDLTLMYSA